ncbi:hypothetical protein [Parapedobacter pyrenivorans]|uniref:hypothetical protein n=1 Tax=Parapedobacter pyrenivorans TaxID=1305674 RepID=UPI0033428E95
MKKLVLLFVTAGILSQACERDLAFETLSITAPALEVQIEGVAQGTEYPKIDGATVEVLNSAGQSLATATTDAKGRVLFTGEQLKEKGVFTVIAQKDALSGEGTTPYLLLNDGVTLFTLTIQ